MKNQKPITNGVVVCAMLLAAGCATLYQSPEEQVSDALAAWKAALEEQDIDAMMALYSEDFQSAEMGSKEELGQMLDQIQSQGYLDNMQVSIDSAEITVEGDIASAGPIMLDGGEGGMRITLEFTKEKGGWLITSST